MFNIGITGMTAFNVMGCGEQRGKTEGYFRGAKVEAAMLPSIQVSIVVSKVPVSLVVDTARRVLYTGAYGDGKIFVYNVENVVKVRTGEQGYDGSAVFRLFYETVAEFISAIIMEIRSGFFLAAKAELHFIRSFQNNRQSIG